MARRFDLGRTLASQGVSAVLSPVEILVLLARHAGGDWGDLSESDKRANVAAIEHGERILSRYEYRGYSIYVISESDRSVTTILLTDEY